MSRGPLPSTYIHSNHGRPISWSCSPANKPVCISDTIQYSHYTLGRIGKEGNCLLFEALPSLLRLVKPISKDEKPLENKRNIFSDQVGKKWQEQRGYCHTTDILKHLEHFLVECQCHKKVQTDLFLVAPMPDVSADIAVLLQTSQNHLSLVYYDELSQQRK